MTDLNFLLNSLISKRQRLFEKKKKYKAIEVDEKTQLEVVYGVTVELSATSCIVNKQEHFGNFYASSTVVVQMNHPHYVQIMPNNSSLYLSEKPILLHFDSIGAIYTNESGLYNHKWNEKDEKFVLFAPHLYNNCKNILSTNYRVLVSYPSTLVIYSRETLVSTHSFAIDVNWVSIFDVNKLSLGMLYITDLKCTLDHIDDSRHVLTTTDIPFQAQKYKMTQFGVLAITSFAVAHIDLMSTPRVQFLLELEPYDALIIDAAIYKDDIYILTENGILKHNLEDP